MALSIRLNVWVLFKEICFTFKTMISFKIIFSIFFLCKIKRKHTSCIHLSHSIIKIINKFLNNKINNFFCTFVSKLNNWNSAERKCALNELRKAIYFKIWWKYIKPLPFLWWAVINYICHTSFQSKTTIEKKQWKIDEFS